MIKIAINLFLTSPKSVTGAFVYIQNILPALFQLDQRNTYYLFGERETINYFKSRFRGSPNIKFYIFDIKNDLLINPLRAIKKALAKIRHNHQAREKIIAEEIRNLIKREKIDIYFSPASTIYPHELGEIKKVTAIMDLQHEYLPENFSPSYRKERQETFSYSVKNSDHLIAISEYTKKTILETYGLNLEKISVIYFAPQKIKSGIITFKMPTDFIFYPAALWPHKNHQVLIEALSKLKERFPSLYAVCPGLTKGKTFKFELEKMAESKGLKDRVIFPGPLFDGDLFALFTQAQALVFPSSFEGFGLPLVEAFQFGLPVIAANNTSITEIVGEAGILVKTGETQALTEAIEKVITDNDLRNNLIKKGYERAKMFSWNKAARETLEIFTRLSVDNKR